MNLPKLLNFLKSKQLFLASVYTFVFVYTLSPFLTSASFILFCGLSLLHFKKNYFSTENLKWLILLSFLFFLYFLGLWFSPYKERSIALIFRISPVFITLLIISFTRLNTIINYDKLKDSLVIGVILSCSISILAAFIKFIITKDIKCFFYFELGSFLHIHPTYYALFIITATHFITFTKNRILKRYLSLITILFYIFIFLLQSKIGLTVFFCYTIYVFITAYKNKEISKSLYLPFFLLLIISFVALDYQDNRFKELFIEREGIEIGNFEEDGISQRAWLWKEALRQVKEKPLFGYGLGAQHSIFSKIAKKEILKTNVTYNYAEAGRKISKLNLHNQFIQILYEFGVLGLLFYVATIIILLVKANKQNNTSFILIQIIFILFLFTENLLDRQVGVYFYCFILPMLFFEKNSYLENKKDM